MWSRVWEQKWKKILKTYLRKNEKKFILLEEEKFVQKDFFFIVLFVESFISLFKQFSKGSIDAGEDSILWVMSLFHPCSNQSKAKLKQMKRKRTK